MSVIIWVLLGLGLGLIVSKMVSTTGEGTVVDILLGVVGAAVGGGMLSLFAGFAVTGFTADSLYSAAAALVGAGVFLVLYHLFFRRRML
jgi:uncharacterized membrane protein YeaQ/YmgE (transglycosylase-associated protein family)